MRCSRVVLAKVAFNVGSEDEVFWVNRQVRSDAKTAEVLRNLQGLADSMPVGPACMSDLALIHSGNTNTFSDLERDHLMQCVRCSRIGQFIANMEEPVAKDRPALMTSMTG